MSQGFAEECRELFKNAPAPLSCRQVYDACKTADSLPQVASVLALLVKRGHLTRFGGSRGATYHITAKGRQEWGLGKESMEIPTLGTIKHADAKPLKRPANNNPPAVHPYDAVLQELCAKRDQIDAAIKALEALIDQIDAAIKAIEALM